MSDGVPRERRQPRVDVIAGDCRHTDHTVDLQKQITALADGISQMGVLLASLTKSVDDKSCAKQQQIGRGCEQRRRDREYSQRNTQRRRHRRHGNSRGRCYGCGQFGHFRTECTRFVSEQSREHVRASRYSGNIQETDILCENVRSDRNYPITKRLVAYQQGTHAQCDVQRDSEMKHEKRRRRPTPESRSGESCWRAVTKSERRHLSTEKRHTPICTSVSFDKQTQTPTSPNALPVVSVSSRSYQEKPHTVADETSYENPVKHDIMDGDRGHKRSEERPKTACTMHPRKAVDVNLKTDPNIEMKVDQSYVKDVDWVRIYRNRLYEADELADKQQRIAAAKRMARHDVNLTDCTLAIGDVVYIRVRTW